MTAILQAMAEQKKQARKTQARPAVDAKDADVDLKQVPGALQAALSRKGPKRADEGGSSPRDEHGKALPYIPPGTIAGATAGFAKVCVCCAAFV